MGTFYVIQDRRSKDVEAPKLQRLGRELYAVQQRQILKWFAGDF